MAKWDVFISCAGEDAAAGRKLKKKLETEGLRILLAVDDLNERVGSAQWSRKIDEAIDESSSVILLVTPLALEKKWVEYEWRGAHDDILHGLGGFLVFVCLEGPGPKELDRALRHHQSVDCRKEAFTDDQVAQIVKLIRGYSKDSGRHVCHGPRARAMPVPWWRSAGRRVGPIGLALGAISVAWLVAQSAFPAGPIPVATPTIATTTTLPPPTTTLRFTPIPTPTAPPVVLRATATPTPTIRATQTPTPAPTPLTRGLGQGWTAEAIEDIESHAWARIPAGTFMMGSEDGSYGEKPVHRVTLPVYRISRYPVTNLQYHAYVRATSARAPKHWKSGEIPDGLEKHPVVEVTWLDAVRYTEWLTTRIAGGWAQLPTEAQWEFAARGSEGREYPWGDAPPSAGRANIGTKPGTTTPVDAYPEGATPEGVHDMVGNVWERCRDLYPPYGSGTKRNPTGPKRDALRGGSWGVVPGYLRAASRFLTYAAYRNVLIGFRVVWSSSGGQE